MGLSLCCGLSSLFTYFVSGVLKDGSRNQRRSSSKQQPRVRKRMEKKITGRCLMDMYLLGHGFSKQVPILFLVQGQNFRQRCFRGGDISVSLLGFVGCSKSHDYLLRDSLNGLSDHKPTFEPKHVKVSIQVQGYRFNSIYGLIKLMIRSQS